MQDGALCHVLVRERVFFKPSKCCAVRWQEQGCPNGEVSQQSMVLDGEPDHALDFAREVEG